MLEEGEGERGGPVSPTPCSGLWALALSQLRGYSCIFRGRGWRQMGDPQAPLAPVDLKTLPLHSLGMSGSGGHGSSWK